MKSIEAKKTGRPHTPNRQGLYAKVAKFAELTIETLVELMIKSKNDNIRLGAAKTLLDKCLPDVKAVELEQNSVNHLIRIVAEKPLNLADSENNKGLNISNGLVSKNSLDHFNIGSNLHLTY